MKEVSKQKEIKQSRTKIDLNLEQEKYADIKKVLVANPFDYRALVLHIDHALLADYLHSVLQEITMEDAAVTSVTLKNGIKLKLQSIK